MTLVGTLVVSVVDVVVTIPVMPKWVRLFIAIGTVLTGLRLVDNDLAIISWLLLIAANCLFNLL